MADIGFCLGAGSKNALDLLLPPKLLVARSRSSMSVIYSVIIAGKR